MILWPQLEVKQRSQKRHDKVMFWITGFLAILALFGPIGASIHPYPSFDELPHPVTLKGSGSRIKRATLGPLRIKVFYHSSVDKLRPKDRRIIKEVVRILETLKMPSIF